VFIDKEICNPGEKVKVHLQTLSPNAHIERFFIGKKFKIREGRRIVGKGKITKIMRPDFNMGKKIRSNAIFRNQ
jgi:translation elongation factor EF-Tu-like GTPase